MTDKKINIHEHIKSGGKGYTAYIASVAGKETSTLTSFLARVRAGQEGTYRTRGWIVDAINKIERTDRVISDFEWSGEPGRWAGNKK